MKITCDNDQPPTGPLNNYWLNTWILQAVPHGMFFHGNDPGGHFGTEWWFVNFGKNGFLMNLVICWFLLHVFQAWKYMQNITDKSTPNQSHQKDTLSMAGFKSAWVWAMNTTMMDWLLFSQRKTAPQKCSVHFHFVEWNCTKSTSTLFEAFPSQNVGVFSGSQLTRLVESSPPSKTCFR